MTAVHWACLDPTCNESGDTDLGARKHEAATQHATTTSLSGRVAAGKKAT